MMKHSRWFSLRAILCAVSLALLLSACHPPAVEEAPPGAVSPPVEESDTARDEEEAPPPPAPQEDEKAIDELPDDDDGEYPDSWFLMEHRELAPTGELGSTFADAGLPLEMVPLPDYDSSRYTRLSGKALAGDGLFFLENYNSDRIIHWQIGNVLYYYDGGSRVYSVLPGVTEIAGTRDNRIYLLTGPPADENSGGGIDGSGQSLLVYDAATMEREVLLEGVLSAHVAQGSDIAYLLLQGEAAAHRHYPDTVNRPIRLVRWDMATGERQVLFVDEGTYSDGLNYIESLGDFADPLCAYDGFFVRDDDALSVTLCYPAGSEVPYERSLRIDRESGGILSDSEAEQLALDRAETARVRALDAPTPEDVDRQRPLQWQEPPLETETIELDGYNLVLALQDARIQSSSLDAEWEIYAERAGERTLLVRRELYPYWNRPLHAGDIAVLYADDYESVNSSDEVYAYDGQALWHIPDTVDFYRCRAAGDRIFLYGDGDGNTLSQLYRGDDGGLVYERLLQLRPAGDTQPLGDYLHKGAYYYGDFIVLDAPYDGCLVFYNTRDGGVAGTALEGLSLTYTPAGGQADSGP